MSQGQDPTSTIADVDASAEASAEATPEIPARVTTPGLTDGSLVERFSQGFYAPFRGIGYLARNPSLLKYALPPALLTGIVMAVLYSLIWGYTGDLVNWIWARPDAAVWYGKWLLQPLWYGLYTTTFVSMLLVGTGASYLVGLPLAGPFNELLSEKVEALETGFDAPFSFIVMLRNIITTLLHVLAFAVLQLMVWSVGAVIGLIPVIGQIIAMGLTLFTAPLLVGFVPLDYPMTIRLWRFTEKLGFMRKNFAMFWGFAVASFLFLYIPFVNLLFLPACVVGGTLMVLAMEKSGELTTRDRRKEILARHQALQARQLQQQTPEATPPSKATLPTTGPTPEPAQEIAQEIAQATQAQATHKP